MSPTHRADCEDCTWSYEGDDIIVVGDRMEQHAQKEQHDVDVTRGVATDGGVDSDVDRLRQITGIGTATAIDLMDEFDSLADLCDCVADIPDGYSPVRISRLEGFGPSRARDVAVAIDSSDLCHDERRTEIVADGGIPVMSGTVTEARPHSTEEHQLVARVLFDVEEVPDDIPVEEWLEGSEVTFSVDAAETDGQLVPDGGHVAGPSHSIAGSPRDFGCSDWHCGGCNRHHVDAEPWITVEGESYCSRDCYATESQFLQAGLHLCEGCQRVFESIRHLAVHDCGAGPLAPVEGGGARA